jgi:predicted acetyltransferase
VISIEVVNNPEQIPDIVKLVFYSMRNKYTSVSNPSGLTFSEVKSIISSRKVSVIKNDNKIVGIINTAFADEKTKIRLGLNSDIDYFNIGLIYIARKERGNGFASEILSRFINEYQNILYIAHESNSPSNKVGSKQLTFFKKVYSFMGREPYNIYTT